MNAFPSRQRALRFFHVLPAESPGLMAFMKRQILGLVSLVLGLFLSIPGVPGPGFVFVVLAFLLMDFPGKNKLIGMIQHRKWFRIARVIIRKKAHTLLILPKTP